MTTVFTSLTGQELVKNKLVRAAKAAAAANYGDNSSAAMTHAWLFTGPPGSGRSVAARCFAAALECQNYNPAVDNGIDPGCGTCQGCLTVLAGTHADVRSVVPEGLSISVAEMRQTVQLATRRPSVGKWQILLIEDADRLTEGAANALLKAVEEPPERTVFLLCAPSDDPEDIAVTLRSRCRHVALQMPSVAAITEVLITRDAVEPEMAAWAASVCGGHIGRAKRLATDADARDQRLQALGIARAATRSSTAYQAADELVKSALEASKALSEKLDATETEDLKTALGAGGTGKGAAGAIRGSAGILKSLERQQKSRSTRIGRDVLDRALVDLVALFRDALNASFGLGAAPMHPDRVTQAAGMANFAQPTQLLRCVEAILACRIALEQNVKPKFAVNAMVAEIHLALSTH